MSFHRDITAINKRCFVYCGDGVCNCQDRPIENLLPLAIELPKPTQDQIDYLEKIQIAVSDYDPNEIIRGRQPPFDTTP